MTAALSKEVAPNPYYRAGDRSEHAEEGEKTVPREEIEGTEHETQFQQPLADVVLEGASFLDIALVVLCLGVLLDLLGVRGKLGAGRLELLHGGLQLGGRRTQGVQQGHGDLALILADLFRLVVRPRIVRLGSVNDGVGMRAMR